MAREGDGTTGNYGSGACAQLTTDLTFAAWVNPDAVEEGGICTWAESPGHATQDKAFGIDGTGKAYGYIFDGASTNVQFDTVLTTGVWSHIAFRHTPTSGSAGNGECWLNGVSDRALFSGIGFSYGGYSSPELIVHRAQTNTVADSGFNGKIAELAIYSSALLESEIALLAAGISPMRIQPQNLFRYFPMFASGTGLEDFGPVGTAATKTGTLTGADHPPVSPMFGHSTVPVLGRGGGGGGGGGSARRSLLGVG